jgi:hypothetical protein
VKLAFFDASIQRRVVYALIASLLWWAMSEIAQTLSGMNGEYLRWATGGVYGALVLVPYLPSLKGIFKLRALALLSCGVLSYWAAIWTATHIAVPKSLEDLGRGLAFGHMLGFAGVVGATIIGIGACLLVPLTLRWDGWLRLMGAGILGGLALSIGFDAGIGGMRPGHPIYWLPGHIAWQVLVCLALYYGSIRDTGLRRDSSVS